MPRIAMLFAFLALASIAHADRGQIRGLDLSGPYTSNWGTVRLEQRGDRVTGTYEYDGVDGRIDGMMDGNMLRFTWHEAAGSGRGVFVLASDGELIGTWGSNDDDTNGGGWRLMPAKPRPQPRAAIGYGQP